jgi:hypothetical protein
MSNLVAIDSERLKVIAADIYQGLNLENISEELLEIANSQNMKETVYSAFNGRYHYLVNISSVNINVGAKTSIIDLINQLHRSRNSVTKSVIADCVIDRVARLDFE